MKNFFALCGMISSAVVFASASVIVPRAALVALIMQAGGIGPLLTGLGGIIFEFILAFIVQAGLTTIELILGL